MDSESGFVSSLCNYSYSTEQILECLFGLGNELLVLIYRPEVGNQS